MSTIPDEILEQFKQAQFYDLNVLLTSPNKLMIVGGRFKSLVISYIPQFETLNIELNCNAKKMMNYIKTRYNAESGWVSISNCKPEDVMGHCVDLDDFLKIFYEK